jgi:3-oxoacyl-[acyl-carrier protein] reductase
MILSSSGVSSMSSDFTGRVALVSGAAQGIGRAVVSLLAKGGARVWASDVDTHALASVAGASATRKADVTDEADLNDLAQEIVAADGRIDVLVHVAGGVRGQVNKPIEQVSEADWHAIMDVNATGAFLTVRAIAPHMKARGYGRIVTISSGAGLRPSLTGIQAYCAAKHAVVGLTRQLSWELAPHGITVNSVAPGFLRSNPSSEAQWQSYSAERQHAIVDGLHTKRLGSADDIAYAVGFFAAEPAGWITGQVLSVDGGRS